MHSDYYLLMTTTPNEEVAVNLARFLVESRLARCVNIQRNIRSIYSWQGDICDEVECLLLIKTGHLKVEELITKLREAHPYELPEIISIPITHGDDDYLRWIWDWVSAEF